MNTRHCTALGLLTLLLLVACGERPSLRRGQRCELNSECEAPLACRLDRCREECRANRDCRAGLRCLRDEGGLGVCQLPEETACVLASDCPAPLVCRMGNCTNACVTDRDCAPGSHCIEDDSGALGCVEESSTRCRLNTDCPDPLVCAVDGLCREECKADRDCRDGKMCVTLGTHQVCGYSSDVDGGAVDGGSADGGSADASTADGGSIDSGSIDSGSMDSGGSDAGADASMTDAGPMDSGMAAIPASRGLLVSGFRHGCAAPLGSALHCWGDNLLGQVGDGTGTRRLSPVPVPGVGTVSALVAGTNHTCAIDEAGLKCWGDNARGQIGDGTMGGTKLSPTPVTIATPVTVALGLAHTCALTASGVLCWGANDEGQLGTGSISADRGTPDVVSGLKAVPVDISARGGHTCALYADGTAECWGRNGDGQVGNRAPSVREPSPVPVIGLSNATAIVAGSNHTCALRSGGAVRCWGDNGSGQLGDGTRTDRPAPVTPGGLLNAVELEAGTDHTCARRATGRVSCWGINGDGQSGQNAITMPWVLSPTDVPIVANAEEVSAGGTLTCARTPGGHFCWGRNNRGQLGDGSMTDSSDPVAVAWP